MRKRQTLSSRPEVTVHLHDHIDVTRDRLDAFVNEDAAVRLLVLARLRERAADQEISLVLTLQASALAVLALLLSQVSFEAESAASPVWPGWGGAGEFGVLFILLAVIALALIAPQVLRAVKGNRDHGRAVVWLGAYEQALAEQASAQGVPPRRSWFRWCSMG